MDEELTKPLGVKQRQARRGGTTMVVLVAIALVSGSLIAWFPQAFPPKPENPSPQVEQESAATVQQENVVASAAKDQSAKTAPADGSEATLTEAKPTGTMVEKKPQPQAELVRQEAALAHLPDPEVSERGDKGILPKRSPEGLRPMDVYSRPPATEGNFGVARVVIIVGGLGMSQTSSQQAIRQLPGPVNLAFAPYGNSLLRWMQEARKDGHELLVQVPMEPFDFPQKSPGPNTLTTDAEPAAILESLHWSMSRITNYVGIMNFLGAKFVTDPEALKVVFDDLASRGVLFVDDGSARNSLSQEVAESSLVPYARAHVVIDADRTRAAIEKQLTALEAEAKRTGIAIGVANAFPESIEMIARFAETAASRGIELTPVSAIVSDPERKR